MSKKISNIHSIDAFIETLARTPAPQHTVNPWDYTHAENALRRNNLKKYFVSKLKNTDGVLLVGEAPGYRGTRRTGVPFSSEKIVLTHSFFTADTGFAIEHTETPIAEASASVVWKTMDELNFYPLIWASFPFHPHHPGNDLTNRPPTRDELLLGQKFLLTLIELFAIKKVVAIGRAAEKTLAELGIPATHIRHPSHGGATQFREGLRLFKKDFLV